MISNRQSSLVFLPSIFCTLLFFGCNYQKETTSAKNPSKGVLFEKTLPTSVIDSFIEHKRIKYKIPAVSLAILKEGEIAYFKNYGVVNAVTQEPITQEAVFEAASITKPVFAYTVCRLSQQGSIDLEETLHERFPFPDEMIEKYPCYTNMTVRHVLTHTSGLPNWGVDLIYCPGEKYGYSGQGFEFLTKALAKSFTEVMDVRIMNYLNEEVLLPFEMDNTYFVESATLKELCVDGHLDGQPSEQEFPESPEMAFGMHSNAKDIAKFALNLLNNSRLNARLEQEFFSIQTQVPAEEKEFDSTYDQGYGLGLYLRQSPYGMVFGHSGSNYDFKCLFEVYEDLKMGYVIMTNSDSGDLLTNEMAYFLIEGIEKNAKASVDD